MSKKYTFTVSKYSSESSKDYFCRTLTVFIQPDNCDSNLYLILRFDSMGINDIEVMPDNSYMANQKLERIAYLEGYFGFKSQSDTVNAVDNLRKNLTNNQIFSTKWDSFIMQFKNWYKIKLFSYLMEELEIRNKIHAL